MANMLGRGVVNRGLGTGWASFRRRRRRTALLLLLSVVAGAGSGLIVKYWMM
jgi:hypothetical protein